MSTAKCTAVYIVSYAQVFGHDKILGCFTNKKVAESTKESMIKFMVEVQRNKLLTKGNSKSYVDSLSYYLTRQSTQTISIKRIEMDFEVDAAIDKLRKLL